VDVLEEVENYVDLLKGEKVYYCPLKTEEIHFDSVEVVEIWQVSQEAVLNHYYSFDLFEVGEAPVSSLQDDEILGDSLEVADVCCDSFDQNYCFDAEETHVDLLEGDEVCYGSLVVESGVEQCSYSLMIAELHTDLLQIDEATADLLELGESCYHSYGVD